MQMRSARGMFLGLDRFFRMRWFSVQQENGERAFLRKKLPGCLTGFHRVNCHAITFLCFLITKKHRT